MALKTICSRLCLWTVVGLISSVAMAAAPNKIHSLDEILKMQTSQARNEQARSGKASNFSVKVPNAAGCTIGGGHCSFDSDCCSNNCYAGACQAGAGSCTIGGGHCSFDSECCSSNCYAGECQAGTGKCSDGGAHCSFDSECCSNNCYAGECQASCAESGKSCTYDTDCCGGKCNSYRRCGDEPTTPGCPH